MNCMKKRSGRRTFLRRAVSLTLTAALLLGQVITSAAAVGSSLVEPTQVTNIADFPNVDIELNVVHDSFGKLTGFVELALRVKTSSWLSDPSNPDSAKEYKYFRSISATLSYDPEVLAPVSWELLPDETTGSVTPDISLAGAGNYSVQFPVKKCDTITGSVAQSGDSTTPGVAGGKSLLFFNAESYKPVKFDGLTTLAVIRFWVKSDDKFSFDTDGTTLLYGTDPADIKKFIGFATDDEIKSSGSPAAAALWYRAEDNEFYFVPEYADDNTKTQNKTVIVKGTTYTITAPATKNEMVQAKKAGETAETTPNPQDYYSYLTNLIPDGNITHTLVSKESFAGGGVSVDSVATIIFLDWDNTILGTQIVPKKADVRKLVNDYVRDTFIYQSDDPALDLTNNTNYSSLARTDNYRGKYPHAGPAPAGDTNGTVNDGEDFPLTNKLDYAFLKRPMEAELIPDPTDPIDPVTPKIPTGKWIQKTDAANSGAPVYDTTYPFVYGWALCASYTDAKNTWTTLGSKGELSDYKVDPATKVAEFTYGGTRKFEMADFGAGFTGGTIYVKAMYEPGADLLGSAYSYKMTSRPYYNKYNDLSAANGGAFQIAFSYERCFESSGNLYGVARIREASIRQDTTTDLKWETDHTLPNATQAEANAKSKTTYSRVSVDNGETIKVDLALSARQNKVDYMLTDTYDSNMVSGDRRSEWNRDQIEAYQIIDNYVYKETGSAYKEREGTQGFVLLGTLNSMQDVAGQLAAGTATNSLFTQYVTINNFNDVNLRTAAGEAFSTPASFTPYQNKFKALIADIYNTHMSAVDKDDPNDPANVNWGTVHDHANLNWHQVQWYLIDDHLYSAAAADAKTLTWCRLHEACIATGSGKPKNWDELLEKSKNSPDDVDSLNLADIESLFGLRSNGAGAPYTSVANFKADIVAAVNQCPASITYDKLSWDDVQYFIVNGRTYPADMTQAAQSSAENHWWYGGETKPADWAGLVRAADVANTQKATSTVTPSASFDRNAGVNVARTAYQKAFPAVGNSDNADWIKYTHNLAMDNQGTAFASFDDFRTALKQAVAAAKTAGEYDVAAGVPTWAQVQYFILHTGMPFPDKTTAQNEADASYFWYDGGKKISDIPSLLLAADRANNGNMLLWNMFDFTAYSASSIDLRVNFHGDAYTAGDFADFKAAILKIVADNGNKGTTPIWEQLQYLLIHAVDAAPPTTIDKVVAQTESGKFYWWKDGGTGAEVAQDTSRVQSNAVVTTLVEAVYRGELNGDPKAMDKVDAALLEAFRLVPQPVGDEAGFATLVKYGAGDVATVTGLIKDLINNAIASEHWSAYAVPTLNWYQVQYALYNGGAYLAKNDSNLPGDADYWWLKKDDNPNAAGAETELDKLLKDMYQYAAQTAADGNDTAAAPIFDDTITAARLKDPMLDLRRTATLYFTSAGQVNNAKKFLKLLSNAAYSANAVDSGKGILLLTWDQVQYALMKSGSYVDSTTAEAENYTWNPYKTTFSLMSLMKNELTQPSETVEVAPPIIETDSETGAVTETCATTTTVKAIDGETGVMTVTSTTVTTTKRSLTDESGVRETVTVSTTVNILTIDLFTGKTESRTEVKPSVVTETFTPVDKPEEPPQEPENPSQTPSEPAPPEGEPSEPGQTPELPEEQPDTPTENPDVPEQKPETPEQQPEDPTEGKPVEKPEPETPALPPKENPVGPDDPIGPPETEVTSLRWINPSVRSADSSSFRGAEVSSVVSLAPVTKGGAANGRGRGIFLAPWAAPPRSVQRLFLQNQSPLWANLPVIARRNIPQAGVNPWYGPILGIRTGT